MMIPLATEALKFQVKLTLRSNLMIRSGETGDVSDSVIERDYKGRLHINGYVWAGLLRRSLERLEQGKLLAEAIGNYGANTSTTGVSPLWCETCCVELPVVDIRHQNRMDRKLQTVASGALYTEEVVPPGLRLKLQAVYFRSPDDHHLLETVQEAISSALWVINEGVETIGGGWSYGFGQLRVDQFQTEFLDLTKPDQRQRLWQWDTIAWKPVPVKRCGVFQQFSPDAVWEKLRLHTAIADGQLLAVSENVPPLYLDEYHGPEMPDTFVFRRTYLDAHNIPGSEIVVPGKAFRQAVLLREIERYLHSRGETMCSDSSSPASAECSCKRCKWFGNTGHRGLIAVADAPVTRAECTILHRISLCEHSFQNINLFSGEYLNHGEFVFEVIIDGVTHKGLDTKLKDAVLSIIEQMRPDSPAPPGWYRLGKTSTATGQLVIRKVEIQDYHRDEQP